MGTIPFVGSQEEPVFKITLIAMGKQYRYYGFEWKTELG